MEHCTVFNFCWVKQYLLEVPNHVLYLFSSRNVAASFNVPRGMLIKEKNVIVVVWKGGKEKTWHPGKLPNC